MCAFCQGAGGRHYRRKAGRAGGDHSSIFHLAKGTTEDAQVVTEEASSSHTPLLMALACEAVSNKDLISRPRTGSSVCNGRWTDQAGKPTEIRENQCAHHFSHPLFRRLSVRGHFRDQSPSRAKRERSVWTHSRLAAACLSI